MSAQNSAPSSTQDQAQKKKRRHLVLGAALAVGAAAGAAAVFPFGSQAEASTTPVVTTHIDGETVNKCSVTFLNDDTAITAGHCGPEGAEVRDGDDVVGKITDNYLVDGKGVDLAVISLEKEYETPDAVEACVDKPAPTTAVTMDGAFSGEQSGAIVSEPVKKDAEAFGQSYPAEYVLTNNSSKPGDSGAPVYAESGCLAGILNGGNGEYSALTFLPEDLLSTR